jgi:uncharacterized DUF497 family protein
LTEAAATAVVGPKRYGVYPARNLERGRIEFAFDPEESDANAENRGIDFVDAQLLWLDDMLLEAPARTVGEPRSLVVGRIADRHWSAVITRGRAAWWNSRRLSSWTGSPI